MKFDSTDPRVSALLWPRAQRALLMCVDSRFASLSLSLSLSAQWGPVHWNVRQSIQCQQKRHSKPFIFCLPNSLYATCMKVFRVGRGSIPICLLFWLVHFVKIITRSSVTLAEKRYRPVNLKSTEEMTITDDGYIWIWARHARHVKLKFGL